ncbi:DNA-binding response regulator TcrA [Propionibacterium freudenreichii]|jgi:two-component system response regulator QseB|nr:DNA-binding response regulator TcrA [Propionibacterium freudenreichii]SBN95158.1 DNA-binding response regulator TcrA [Propionibacterium freudenreichii]SCC96744.1 DNA-binding response regulator TcrA [Propionibacterium freudenreichii]SCQ48141.1 DNA-binding response regulator TcrA [Propionibacterium freudenreichii]
MQATMRERESEECEVETETRRPALLLVEDDEDIAGMLSEVLADLYKVDHVPDAERGLDVALRRHFDVIVVDRRLPGMDGVALIRAIRRANITTPVLMLTALGTLEDKVSGLDGGANDYLVKPFEFDELLARLRALRRAFTAEGRRRYLGEWIYTPDNKTVYSPTGGRILLTVAENALLDLISSSPERVFSREEILHAAFSSDDSPGTVDTYVHYLRKKTSREMVETVRAHGYRLGDRP